MERQRDAKERGREGTPPGERDARVDRQDATGIDVPAGRAAKDVTPEEYRPTEILDDDEEILDDDERDGGEAARGRS